jgi:hypothetical protein
VAGIHSRNTQLGNIRQTSPLVLQPLEKEKEKKKEKTRKKKKMLPAILFRSFFLAHLVVCFIVS